MSRKTAYRKAKRQARRGFTLLEIIVVVTIIALLAALVAPKLLGNIGRSKQRIATAEIASIRQQVQIYLVDNQMSTIPADFELEMLVEGEQPYLEPDALLDPWERPYVLVIPGEVHSDFDITSYGADGEPGGEGEDADVS
jgi:general secretion pathway protein G